MEGKESSEGTPSPTSKFKNLRKLNLGKLEPTLGSHMGEILKRNCIEVRGKEKVDYFQQAVTVMEALSAALFGDDKYAAALRTLLLAYLKNCFVKGVKTGHQVYPVNLRRHSVEFPGLLSAYFQHIDSYIFDAVVRRSPRSPSSWSPRPSRSALSSTQSSKKIECCSLPQSTRPFLAKFAWSQ
jgi:hypothetical protein